MTGALIEPRWGHSGDSAPGRARAGRRWDRVGRARRPCVRRALRPVDRSLRADGSLAHCARVARRRAPHRWARARRRWRRPPRHRRASGQPGSHRVSTIPPPARSRRAGPQSTARTLSVGGPGPGPAVGRAVLPRLGPRRRRRGGWPVPGPRRPPGRTSRRGDCEWSRSRNRGVGLTSGCTTPDGDVGPRWSRVLHLPWELLRAWSRGAAWFDPLTGLAATARSRCARATAGRCCLSEGRSSSPAAGSPTHRAPRSYDVTTGRVSSVGATRPPGRSSSPYQRLRPQCRRVGRERDRA